MVLLLDLDAERIAVRTAEPGGDLVCTAYEVPLIGLSRDRMPPRCVHTVPASDEVIEEEIARRAAGCAEEARWYMRRRVVRTILGMSSY